MKQLRVGIIGAGMAFERLHYPAYQELADRYKIAAVCDQDRFKAEDWSRRLGLSNHDVYTDHRELLRRDDLDLVDIMLPIELNFEAAEAAARAGKPAVCEKPIAPTLKQAEAFLDLTEKHHVPMIIAENYRYNEEVNILRDLVRTHRVGFPLYFIWNRFLNFPKEMRENKFAARDWRQHPEFPGGVILDYAVHDMAALHHMFGPVDTVHAIGRRQEADFAPYSVVNVNMCFTSDLTGQYTFWCGGEEVQHPLIGLRIIGDQGQIYLEERDAGVINVFHPDGTSEQIHYRPRRGYVNELLNFYNHLVEKEPLSVTPDMEFGDALMIFRILESLKCGDIMAVDRNAFFVPAEAIGGTAPRRWAH